MNPAEFDNIARSERDFWWYRGMRDVLFGLLDPLSQPAAHVLEAGCGTGYLSKLLAARYQWRMTPLDLGREGLEFARGYGLERLVQGDITALPFPAATFDAVVSMDVIVHLPRGEESRALAEFARVLKSGGLLALRVAAMDLLHSRHSEFAQERQRFTRSRLTAAVEAVGLKIDRITYLNALLLPVALFKFRVWEPLTRAPAASGVTPVPQWLDRLLYFPLQVEAAWIGRGGSFPAGQSLVLLARKPRSA
jgi:ubiquinone/menaquinone biosynthesis C-methylase UbiE